MENEKLYEVILHGYDHADYFQGCGTFFTKYTECYTGAGSTEYEAYDDAMNQIYSTCSEEKIKELNFEELTTEDFSSYSVPEDAEDVYYYVSIRF